MLIAALAAIQLVRFERTNPPVTGDLGAPPEVDAVLRRACYDCHSNETAWPWYSRIAPVSWLTHRDVVDGRAAVNFSQWNALLPAERADKIGECLEAVEEGEMPPWYYRAVRPAARLSAADEAVIARWAVANAGPAR